MFEPLSKIIDMLRSYGVVIPEESLVQLQELPDKWANTKRLSVMAIQQVTGFTHHLVLPDASLIDKWDSGLECSLAMQEDQGSIPATS